MMTSDQTEINQRLAAVETRLERLDGQFQEEAGFLLDGLRSLSAQTTNLANQVDRLVEVAIADREEIRRIWEYLESQQRSQGNGQS